MTAPTIDATLEREIGELYDALLALAPRWDWARAHPEAAADSLKLGGRVREAVIFAIEGENWRLSGEEASAPVAHHRAFWRS